MDVHNHSNLTMTDTTKIDDRAEQLVLKLAEEGVFRIDTKLGEIWRIGVKNRGVIKPCEVRRAEYEANNGYLRIRVMVCSVRVRVSAHRVIYRAHYGSIPEGCIIDHGNRVRCDNRIVNLEAVTQSENVRRALGLPPMEIPSDFIPF